LEVVQTKRSDWKGEEHRRRRLFEWEQKNPKKVIVSRARQRARKHGLPFDLSTEDFEIPEVCPILGTELSFNKGGRSGHFPNSPSLDRVDPALGYVKGNVRVISARANWLKSDASLEELERVVEDLRLWKR
jgi:hypothetical protein